MTTEALDYQLLINQNQSEQHCHNCQLNAKLQTARKPDGTKLKKILELYKNIFSLFCICHLSMSLNVKCLLNRC